MRKIYLDTSAVNSIFHSENHRNIFLSNIDKFKIYISAVNLIEIIRNPNPEERLNLLKFAREIAQGRRPLALPSELLRYSLEAYSARASEMLWSVREEQEGLWVTLNEPELVDERAHREALDYSDKQESWYKTMHREARADVQKVLKEENLQFPSSSELIISYYMNTKFLNEFFCPIFQDLGHGEIFQNRAQLVLKELEPWKFYFAGMTCGVYNQTFKSECFSPKKNAGGLDTEQSIYLAACDVFVTDDGQQREVLNTIVKYGNIEREILNVDGILSFVSC